MKIRVEIKEGEYFLKLLNILRHIPPFSLLRNQEIEVLAKFYEYNHKLREIPTEQRNLVLFSHDTKEKIAKELHLKTSRLYNIITGIKKVGIIKGDTLIPKYTLYKHNEVIFSFENEE